MSTTTIRPNGTIDLGYMSLVGSLQWDAAEQELSIRGVSGFSDFIAGPRAVSDGNAILATPGCVLIEDWGSSRRLLEALKGANIIRVLAMHEHGDSTYAEARVITIVKDLHS